MRRFQLRTALLSAIVLFAGLAGGAGDASAATPSPWYQTGWNQSGAGFNPSEQTLTAAHVPGLSRAWSVQTNGPCCIGPAATSVVSTGGTAYFGGADNELYAVDAATGAPRWHATTPGCVLGSAGPALHLGILLVPTQECSPDDFNSWLSAYDASTGRFLWSYRSALSMSAPLTVNGVAYVQSRTEEISAVRLDAIDVRTGHVRWHRMIGSAVRDLAADTRNLYSTSATSLQAMDPRTGAIRWARPVAGGHVLVSSGHVVVAGAAGGRQVITSFSATGSRQWAVRPAGAAPYEISATASELVVAGADGRVQARSLTAGRATWSRALAGSITSQPAIAGGVVYVTVGTPGTSSVEALRDGVGTVLWSFTYTQPGGGVPPFPLGATDPSVAAGSLFVSLGETGLIQAFRAH